MGACSSAPNEAKTEPIAWSPEKPSPVNRDTRSFSDGPVTKRIHRDVEDEVGSSHVSSLAGILEGPTSEAQASVEMQEKSNAARSNTVVVPTAVKSTEIAQAESVQRGPPVKPESKLTLSAGSGSTGVGPEAESGPQQNSEQDLEKQKGEAGKEQAKENGGAAIKPKSRNEKRRGSLFDFLVEEEKKGGTSKLVAELTDTSWKEKSTEGIDKAVAHDIFVIADDGREDGGDGNDDDDVFDEVESGSDSDSSEDSDHEYEEIQHDPKIMLKEAAAASSRRSVDGVFTSKSLRRTIDSSGNKYINQYSMVRKIGEGQFGNVKLCKDTDGNEFAVKVMNKALKQQSMRTQSIAGKAAMHGISAGNEFSNVEYEIAIMKKIQHPNVVKLTEVINDPNHDKVFLVMEYVKGGAVCADEEPVEPLVPCACSTIPNPLSRQPLDLAWKYARGITLGLDYLHRQGIVHGDIKPSNILLDPISSTVKITDFGTSLHTNQINNDAKRMGSPAFMAPELVAEDGEHSGSAVDIWALGVTIHMFIFGTIPFKGSNMLQLVNSIIDDEFTMPKEANNKAGLDIENLNSLFDFMLTKDAQIRISTLGLLAHPWLTKNGTEPMQQTQADVEISAEDIDDAVKSLQSISAIIGIKRRVSKVLKEVRRKLQVRKKLQELEKHRKTEAMERDVIGISVHAPEGAEEQLVKVKGTKLKRKHTFKGLPLAISGKLDSAAMLRNAAAGIGLSPKGRSKARERRHSLFAYRSEDKGMQIDALRTKHLSGDSGMVKQVDELESGSDSDESDYGVDEDGLETVNDILEFVSKTKTKGFDYINTLPIDELNKEACTSLKAPKITYSCISEMGGMKKMEDAFSVTPNMHELASKIAGKNNNTLLGTVDLGDKLDPADPRMAPVAFFGVYDGHSGSHVSEFLAEGLNKAVAASDHFPKNWKDAVLDGFREADDIIISEVATVVGGSTGIVAMIRDTDVIVANLGDCRAVLSKRGKAIDISKDHKPDSESEQKRIEAAGGFVRAHRLMGILGVARAFGDNEYKEGKNRAFPDRTFTENPLSNIPEIHEFELQLGDEFLVMACDGLWDVISSQEAVTCIKDELMQRRSPQQALQKLFEEAMDRSTVDNVTIILICFEPSSAAQQPTAKPAVKSLLRENRVASEINLGHISKESLKNRGKRSSTIIKTHEVSGLTAKSRRLVKKADKIAKKTTTKMAAVTTRRKFEHSGKINPLTPEQLAVRKETSDRKKREIAALQIAEASETSILTSGVEMA